MLLWVSIFAIAKIECSFEMGKQTPLGVSFIFAVDGTTGPLFLMLCVTRPLLPSEMYSGLPFVTCTVPQGLFSAPYTEFGVVQS